MLIKNISKIKYIALILFFCFIIFVIIILFINNKNYPIAETSGITYSDTPVDTTHYSPNTLKPGITISATDTFFDNSVFIGDSVTLGFQICCDKILGDLTIFGIGNYGIANALKPISEDSIHPLYKGKQIQVWNLLKKMKTEKVFLMFGLNDIGLYGVKDSLTNYTTLINAIKEHNPKIKIYIVSTTPLTPNFRRTLNNDSIREFNNYIRTNAENLGITYIDVASYLINLDGYLEDQYCSDGLYHLNSLAYKQWVNVLRSFASYNL